MLFVAVCVLHTQGPAQSSASSNIYAAVVQAYSAVKTSQINFGDFSTGSEGGMLVLAPQGKLSVNGSIVTLNEIHKPASYYVVGDKETVFSITLPESPATLINNSGSKTLLVSNWESALGANNDKDRLTDGVHTVYVGATLEVGSPADELTGTYTGMYTVTFDFN